VLILDEPMGGLDPAGRVEVLSALSDLRHKERYGPVTIVMTESDPEPVATFADRLIVLSQGHIALEGSPRTLFYQVDRLKRMGVPIPQLARLGSTLNHLLGTCFDFITVNEALEALAEYLD
jgi:energy-coupling factor transport system ATP-binding protein